MTAALIAGLVAGYGVAIPIGAIAPLLMSLTARTSLRVGAAAALGVATADGLYALVAVLGGASLARWIEPIAVPLRWVAVAILLLLAGKIAVDTVKQWAAGAVERFAIDCTRAKSTASPEETRASGVGAGVEGFRAGSGRGEGTASPEETRASGVGAGVQGSGIGSGRGEGMASGSSGVAAGAERAGSAAAVGRRGVRWGLETPGRAFAGLLGLTLLNPATILYFGALVVGWQTSGGYDGFQGTVWTVAVFAASASWQLSLAGGGALIGRVLDTRRGRLWTGLISSLMIAGLAGTVLIK